MQFSKNYILLATVVVLIACSPSDNSTVDPAEIEASPAPAVVADTVYTNGKVYTINDARPWAEAVAIKGGKFLVVGSASDVEAVTGPLHSVLISAVNSRCRASLICILTPSSLPGTAQ